MIEYVHQHMNKLHVVRVRIGTMMELGQVVDHLSSLGFLFLNMSPARAKVDQDPKEQDGYVIRFHKTITIASTSEEDRLTLDGRYTLESEGHKEVHQI